MSAELIIPIIVSIGALCYGAYLISWVVRQSAGDDKMKAIALAIQQGAQAYLNRQYTTILFVAIPLVLLLGYFLGLATACAFIVGAALSGAAGYIGMNVSVRANVRTAQAAKQGMKPALEMAVKG